MWVYIVFVSHLIIFLAQGAPLTQDQQTQLALHTDSCPGCYGGSPCSDYRDLYELYHQQALEQQNQQRRQSPPAQPQPPPIPQSQLPAVANNVARFGISGDNPMPAPIPVSTTSAGYVAPANWNPQPRRTQSLEIRSDGPDVPNQNQRGNQLTIGTKRSGQMMMQPNYNQGFDQQASNVESSSGQVVEQPRKRGRKDKKSGTHFSADPEYAAIQREMNKRRVAAYRDSIGADASRYEQYLAEGRSRYHANKASGKVKSIKDMSEDEQKAQREKWNKANKTRMAKERAERIARQNQ